MADNAKSFWQTVPGVITATAALITAIGGLIGILIQAGVIGKDDRTSGATPTAVSTTGGQDADDGQPAGTAPTDTSTLIPWQTATATLVLRDGSTQTVKAATVGLACNTDVVELENGQRIELQRVGSIRFDTIYVENSSADGAVTLLDGREITEPIHTWNCPITGSNELGSVEVNLEDIQRIEFQR